MHSTNHARELENFPKKRRKWKISTLFVRSFPFTLTKEKREKGRAEKFSFRLETHIQTAMSHCQLITRATFVRVTRITAYCVRETKCDFYFHLSLCRSHLKAMFMSSLTLTAVRNSYTSQAQHNSSVIGVSEKADTKRDEKRVLLAIYVLLWN